MATRRKTNFPDLAESQFQSLCDEHGVNRNKAIQDRTGWDYLLEFDRTPIVGAAHDRQPGSSTARVQVKSTVGGKARTELKLSNAMRFTGEADICFVVLFQFSRDGLSTRIFARHFHADLMMQSLKRAREADHAGMDALHRIRIPVTFDVNDDHTHDLLAWMHSICDQQPESYAVDKRRLADTLGYGDGSYRGTYTIKVENFQAMVDNAVGLIASTPIEYATIEDRRFGIPARNPIFEGVPTLFSINVPPQPATLTVRGINGYGVNISGEMRTAALPGLPMETARAVFSSPCLQYVIRGDGDNEVSWALAGEVKYRLSDMMNFAVFQKALRSPTELSLAVEGRTEINTAAPVQSSNDDEWFDWFHTIVEGLTKVCTAWDHLEMSLHDIREEAGASYRFAQFLSDGQLRLQFTLANVIAELPKVRNLLGYGFVRVGGHTFWAITRRPCLSLEREGMKITIIFGAPLILDGGATSLDKNDIGGNLKARLITVSPQIGSGNLMLNDGEFAGGGDSLDINYV